MRRIGIRSAAISASLVLAASITQVAHGGAPTGSVVFQLTLRGDVPTGESFRILRDTDPPSIIEPGLLVCAPFDPDGGVLPECETGVTYELESPTLPVGTVLLYSVVRSDRATGPSGGERVHGLAGTVTVRAGARSTPISLTYDYSLGQLPDTAQSGYPQVGSPASGGGVGYLTSETATQPHEPSGLFALGIALLAAGMLQTGPRRARGLARTLRWASCCWQRQG